MIESCIGCCLFWPALDQRSLCPSSVPSHCLFCKRKKNNLFGRIADGVSTATELALISNLTLAGEFRCRRYSRLLIFECFSIF